MGFTPCSFTWTGFGIHLITAVSVVKRLGLYKFSLWGRYLVSVVLIKENPYYRGFFFLKKIYENFVGTMETVRNIEVSVPRGSTVVYFLQINWNWNTCYQSTSDKAYIHIYILLLNSVKSWLDISHQIKWVCTCIKFTKNGILRL